jgi:hypothetical protein
MTDPTLEERVNRLERTVRRYEWMWGILVPVVLFFPLYLHLFYEPIFVEGEVVQIRDQQGKRSAVLTEYGRGGQLSLRDSQSDERMFLGYSGDGHPSVLMRNGKQCVLLGFSDDGEPGLWLADENGKWRSALRLSEKGPELKLVDEDGKDVFSAP